MKRIAERDREIVIQALQYIQTGCALPMTTRITTKRRPVLQRKTIHLLIERDGPNCCWCGVTCSFSVKPSGDIFPTVEHVIRRAEGGTSDLANLKVSCRKCNNERHGKDSFVPRA